MLTLAVHGLFVLLLLLEKRFPPRDLPPSRQLVSLWIQLPPEPAPSASTVAPPPPILRERESVVVRAPPVLVAPEPAVESPPTQPAEDLPPSGIDWHGEAARLAALGAGEPAAPPTMGRPLQKMREPCEPRDSSFDWSAEVPKAGLLPLPYVIIADRCMITVGFFSCVLGPLPPPNKHLFDDMVAGKTPDSSVPDPNVCD